MPGNSNSGTDASDSIDAPIDDLVRQPVNLYGAFTVRNADGGLEPASLAGLPTVTTYSKTYQLLRSRLVEEESEYICDIATESDPPHQAKLDRFLATLSDAQFETLARILACSRPGRHRVYLGICALIPSDLVILQRAQDRRAAAAAANPNGEPGTSRAVYVAFSASDVPGAEDLLLSALLGLPDPGTDFDQTTLILLQRFAVLARVVAGRLRLAWLGKWPVDWAGIDRFTLDLRGAYGADGVYLAGKRWLEGLGRMRNLKTGGFRVLAPSGELEREAYEAFGVEGVEGGFS